MDRRMQALDDDYMDRVSGGVGFFRTIFGDDAVDGMDEVIPPPAPTAQKECFGPLGKHAYPNGSDFCQYCGKPRPKQKQKQKLGLG